MLFFKKFKPKRNKIKSHEKVLKKLTVEPIQQSSKSESLGVSQASGSLKSTLGDFNVWSQCGITAVGSEEPVKNFNQGNNLISFAFLGTHIPGFQ